MSLFEKSALIGNGKLSTDENGFNFVSKDAFVSWIKTRQIPFWKIAKMVWSTKCYFNYIKLEGSDFF